MPITTITQQTSMASGFAEGLLSTILRTVSNKFAPEPQLANARYLPVQDYW